MKQLKLSKSEEFARKHCIITMPKIRLYVGWKLYDKEGSVVSQWKDEAHSFVRNFKNMERTMFFAVNADDGADWNEGFLNFKNTSGAVVYTSKAIFCRYASETPQGYRIGIYNDVGIQVGTGVTGVTQDDYKLDTLISTGSSAGQLTYGTVVATNTYYPDTKIWEMNYTRNFVNNSGGSITVNEQGMHFWVYRDNSEGGMLVARDLIAPVTINNGANASFEYDMQMTFPA